MFKWNKYKTNNVKSEPAGLKLADPKTVFIFNSSAIFDYWKMSFQPLNSKEQSKKVGYFNIQ